MEINLSWVVYIVQTKNGKLYTGVTTDLTRRIRQHRGEIAGGAKFFRSNPPVKCWEIGRFDSRSSAQKEEARIKKLKRIEKRALINRGIQSPF